MSFANVAQERFWFAKSKLSVEEFAGRFGLVGAFATSGVLNLLGYYLSD